MKPGEFLRKLGGRLGIIKVAALENSSREGAPRKVTMRNIALNDLKSEVLRDEVRALAELPAELSVSFDRVFEAAGIKPPAHAWTVDRLRALLQTDQYKTLDRPSVQKALLGLLASEKVAVEDLVKDTIARDQALDAFEAFVRRKMDDRESARQAKIAELREKIGELERDCVRQAEESTIDAERWKKWLDDKIAYEKDMTWAVGYLVERPVVTVQKPGPDK